MILRESVELCAQLHEAPRPPGWTRCAGIRRMLGEALLRSGDHADAETVLLASHTELNSLTDKWALIDLRKSLLHLTELYEATGRPAEAAEWKWKLAVIEERQTGRD